MKLLLKIFLTMVVATTMSWSQYPSLSEIRPQTCDNGLSALYKDTEQLTDCKYLNFLQNINREERLKHWPNPVIAYQDYPYLFAQKDLDTWVLMDYEGKEAIGNFNVTTDRISYRVSELKEGIDHIGIQNEYYLHFKKENKIEGPFLNHWKSPGCVQHGPPESQHNEHTARYTLDTTLVIYNQKGELLELEPGLSEFRWLKTGGFSTRSADGQLQLRDKQGKIFFEGEYFHSSYVGSDNRYYLSSKPIQSILTARSEIRSLISPLKKVNYKYAVIDSTGKIILDTLYNKIEPFPTRAGKNKLHVARLDSQYALLDTNLQTLIELQEKEIILYGADIFGIRNMDDKELTIYQEDKKNILFKNLTDYNFLGHHIITENGKSYMADKNTLKRISKNYTAITISNLKSSHFPLHFTNDRGQAGFLNSKGEEILKIKADSLFKLSSRGYNYVNEIRDSLCSFGRADTYGIYNLKTEKELSLESDEPIILSRAKDIFIISKDKLKGMHHYPSGKSITPIYKSIYAREKDSYGSEGVFWDYHITAKLPDNKQHHFYIHNDKLIRKSEITKDYKSWTPQVGIKLEDGRKYFYDHKVGKKLLPYGYKYIKEIKDSESNIKYYEASGSTYVKYYDAKLNMLTPERHKWTKVRAIDESNDIILLTSDKKKGVFDLSAQAYIYPPEYRRINMLNDNTVALHKEGAIALGDMEGNIITDFDYLKIEDGSHREYYIVQDKSKQFHLLDSIGKKQLVGKISPNTKGISIIKSDTDYYFQVFHEKDSTVQVFDTKGRVIMDYHSKYVYVNLDGPLDMLVQPYSGSQKGAFVKDLTTDPVTVEGTMLRKFFDTVIEKRDGYYYQSLISGERVFYNQEGRELLRVDEEKTLTYINSRDKKHESNMFCFKNESGYDVYDLSGKLLIKECNPQRSLNSFGQWQFLNANGAYYFLDPVMK